MAQLAKDGKYTIPQPMQDALEEQFDAGSCDDADTAATIRRLYETEKYLCDTHTAVAVTVYEDYRARTGDETPTVIASTASPFKFCKSVTEALGGTVKIEDVTQLDVLHSLTGQLPPAPLAALKGKQPRFNRVVEKEDILSTTDLLAEL